MMIHIVCLMILLSITLFSIITGNNLITVGIDEAYSFTQTLNGTITEVELPDIATSLFLDPLIQAVIWISIIAGIIIISSITVLSSGLSEIGSKWIGYSIFYISIWIILSTLSFPLITSIELIGVIIYITLTILYAIGVIVQLGTSS